MSALSSVGRFLGSAKRESEMFDPPNQAMPLSLKLRRGRRAEREERNAQPFAANAL